MTAGGTKLGGGTLVAAAVAAELVGEQHVRRSPRLLQELAEQAFGGLLVAPALDEDFENIALLVDRAPEPVLLAGYAEDDLVKVPFVAAAGGSPTNASDEFPAEFQAPLPDTLVVTEMPRAVSLALTLRRSTETGIQPDRIADELGGVAITSVKRVSGPRHPGQIPVHPGSAKLAAAKLDETGQPVHADGTADANLTRLSGAKPPLRPRRSDYDRHFRKRGQR